MYLYYFYMSLVIRTHYTYIVVRERFLCTSSIMVNSYLFLIIFTFYSMLLTLRVILYFNIILKLNNILEIKNKEYAWIPLCLRLLSYEVGCNERPRTH